MYIDLNVKYMFFSDFNEILIFLTDFRNINIKFHENLSTQSRVLCGRTDRRTNTTKQIGAFRKIAKSA